MKLFIQVRNGQPFEHPIMADNFYQAFPHLDENNLPPEFAKFEKPELPTIDIFEVVDGSSYVMQPNGVVKEVWAVRPMTDAEKAIRIQDAASQIDNTIAFYKNFAAIEVAKATGDAITSWQEYISMLNEFTYTDPFAASVPPLPRYASNGEYLTNNMPGSAPNVTG
jgi:hypothetical protein